MLVPLILVSPGGWALVLEEIATSLLLHIGMVFFNQDSMILCAISATV